MVRSVASRAADMVGAGRARYALGQGPHTGGRAGFVGVGGLVGGTAGSLGGVPLQGAVLGGLAADRAYGAAADALSPLWSLGSSLLDHAGKTPGGCMVQQVTDLALGSRPSGPLHRCLGGAGVAKKDVASCREFLRGEGLRTAKRVVQDATVRLVAAAELHAPTHATALQDLAERVFDEWEANGLDLDATLRELSNDLDYAVALSDCTRVVDADDTSWASGLRYLSTLSGPEIDYASNLWLIARVLGNANACLLLCGLLVTGARNLKYRAQATEEEKASEFARGLRYAKLQLWRGMTVTLPGVRAAAALGELASELRGAKHPGATEEERRLLDDKKRAFERLVAEVSVFRPTLVAMLRAVATCGDTVGSEFRRGVLRTFTDTARGSVARAAASAKTGLVRAVAAVPRLAGAAAGVGVGALATPMLAVPASLLAREVAESVATGLEISLGELPSDVILADVRRIDTQAGAAVEELRRLLPVVRHLLVDGTWAALIDDTRLKCGSHLLAAEIQPEIFWNLDAELYRRIEATRDVPGEVVEYFVTTSIRQTIGAVLRGEPEKRPNLKEMCDALKQKLGS